MEIEDYEVNKGIIKYFSLVYPSLEELFMKLESNENNIKNKNSYKIICNEYNCTNNYNYNYLYNKSNIYAYENIIKERKENKIINSSNTKVILMENEDILTNIERTN